MDAKYIIALERNISAYLKHREITIHHWINPRVVILVKLFDAYPEPLAQSSFIDDLHDYNTISRAVNHLEDKGFVSIERIKASRGTPPKYLHLTDMGKQFINHIDPEEE
jgi:DNA-binding HxlR family transcriptional regulator